MKDDFLDPGGSERLYTCPGSSIANSTGFLVELLFGFGLSGHLQGQGLASARPHSPDV
jgi:hypothetical protein